MAFHELRRQQFLGEETYKHEHQDCSDGIHNIEIIISKAVEDSDLDYASNRASFQALLRFQRLVLKYTAGEPIEPLRTELEEVVAAYERYGEYLWKYTGDRNTFVFEFSSIDDYCQLMQLIGLCFLLHRRDLLSRIAALQDGENGANGGADNLYEEFMSHGLGAETRYESDWIFASKPYQSLSDALYSETNNDALKNIDCFLKRWYKDLAGTGWHDAHIEQAGYYGYWSFEAGAAVLLLGIEDDSSLHKYLYYPKHLVAWAKENAQRFPDGGMTSPKTTRLNVHAGQPCPEAGWWFTPAQANSCRYFKQGENMPSLGGDYGLTFWQWSPDQSVPTL
ncbi:PoNe immunity protein domain-containing protein [Azonexus sp. IMCC34842]|uniref:PoNe immunity protein domain-containing protein n=1 Tax=Azonexus sp. IMCC34842 TaxID=3420950 RepID=UPI003D0DC633